MKNGDYVSGKYATARSKDIVLDNKIRVVGGKKDELEIRAKEDFYNPKENRQQIEKYYVEGIEFSRAQMAALFTELVFEKLKHKQKRNYCGKNMEVRYEYI